MVSSDRMELDLPSAASHIGQARSRIRDLARSWDLPAELIEDLTLATSELVTNAVIHARSRIRVTVTREADCIRLEVADNHPEHPAAALAGDEAVSGRGLLILRSISRSWGVEAGPEPGKRVWAELALPG